MPTSIIAKETTKPVIYSTLPCPKGCSLSAGVLESLKPISVTIDDPASERLLNASATIEIDAVNTPAANLPANKKRFKTIPTAPLKTPYFARTCGDEVFL